MKPAIPYIAFPGTCQEAMRTYAQILGGEVTLMTTMADAPVDFPPEAAGLIFNSEVRVGDLVLRASDNPDWSAVGSSMSIFVRLDDPARQRDVHEQLADGGSVLFPLEGGFGMVTDRFGVQWMLALEE